MENKQEITIPAGSKEVGLRVDLTKTAAALIVGNALLHGVIESSVTPIDDHGPKITYGYHTTEHTPASEIRSGVYGDDFNLVPYIEDVKTRQVYGHVYDPERDHGLEGGLPAWSNIFQQTRTDLYKGLFTQQQLDDGSYLTQLKADLKATPQSLLDQPYFVDITAIPPTATMDYIADGMLIYESPPTSGVSQEVTTDTVNHARTSVAKMLRTEHFDGMQVVREMAQLEPGLPLNFGEYKELMGLVTKYEYRSFPAMLAEWRKGSRSHMSAELKAKLSDLEARYKDEAGLKIEIVPVESTAKGGGLSAGIGCVVPTTKNPEATVSEPSNITIPLLLPLLIATPFIRRRRLKAAQLEQNALIPSRKQQRLVEEGGGTIRDKLEVQRYSQVITVQKEEAQRAKERAQARASKLPRVRHSIPKRFWAFNAAVVASSIGLIGFALNHERPEKPAPVPALANGKTNNTSVYHGVEREVCQDDMPIIYDRFTLGK